MAKTIQIAENGMIVNVILVDDAAAISKNGKRIDWEGDGLDAPPGATFMAVDDAQIGWLLKNGVLVAPPPPEPPPPPILTLLPMAEFWRRVTDDEAEAVEAAFGQARLRLRRIFEAEKYLDTTDKDYSSLREVIAGAIETERVAEILAPSE